MERFDYMDYAIELFTYIGWFPLLSGIIMVFFPDTSWKSTEWSNAISGTESERTDAWDTWNGCVGWFGLAMGIVWLILICGIISR